MPTAEVIQGGEVTTPKVPVISGRVVKFNTILSLPLFAIGWVQISRGSRASRRPSPRRLKPSTTRKIAAPGHQAIQGAWVRKFFATFRDRKRTRLNSSH